MLPAIGNPYPCVVASPLFASERLTRPSAGDAQVSAQCADPSDCLRPRTEYVRPRPGNHRLPLAGPLAAHQIVPDIGRAAVRSQMRNAVIAAHAFDVQILRSRA